MKKNILEINNVLTSLKNVASTKDREYIRLIWAVTNHIAIQSSLGREQEVSILTDLRSFIDELNAKYPIERDITEKCEDELSF
ncbi:hypothetical protein [Vibrio barjaei]|uniref:hypothetical protein n=1 Tax=Vibrio barjaei TaxID=1676683 RepID=UPI001160B610|nr:hypothetical protein [Vibrio barjaei]